MTWQDELRALDEKLAAGSISAEEYRRTRDNVLAKSISPMPVPEPPRDAQPDGPARTGQHAAGAPPAPGAEPARPNPPAPPKWSIESTQFIQPVTPAPPDEGGSGEKTQVVSAGDVERTQVVSGRAGWPAPGSGQPQNWHSTRDVGQNGPPWGHPDFEPIRPAPEAWLRQGPEAFNTGSGNRGKIIGIGLAVLLVVGVVVAGIVFLTNRGSDVAAPANHGTTTTAATPTTPKITLPAPPPTKAAPVDTQHALIDPPGTTRGGGGPLDAAALSNENLLPKSIVDALGQAGMTDGLLKTTENNGVIVGIYGFTVRSQNDASSVAQAYTAEQTHGGVPTDTHHALQGVPAFSTPPSAGTSVFRAVYVLYNRVIIVETLGADRNAVEQTFSQILHDQVALAPPTVRGS